MAAIRISPDQKKVLFELPDGSSCLMDEPDETGVCSAVGDMSLLAGDDGQFYIGCVQMDEVPDGIYRLTRVDTKVEKGANV